MRPSRLADLTTLRVGGAPAELAEPAGTEEAADLIARCVRDGLPWRVLGRGSNLVVSDRGVPGLVLLTRRMRELRFHEGGRVTAGAGLPTSVLLASTRARGLGGLEALVGYPASVGGAARMNAGGHWGETGERVESVTAVTDRGDVVEVPARHCGFAYRTSRLTDVVVTAVTFLLPEVDPDDYRARVEEIHVEKARAQPLDLPSAGCVFRNPPAEVAGGRSAGRLVDECGFKGRRRGGAAVSEVHGNFVVNVGGATSDDVLGLVDEIRDGVRRSSGVELELEVEIWGDEGVPAAV